MTPDEHMRAAQRAYDHQEDPHAATELDELIQEFEDELKEGLASLRREVELEFLETGLWSVQKTIESLRYLRSL